MIATTATNFAELSDRFSISVVGNIPTEYFFVLFDSSSLLLPGVPAEVLSKIYS